VKLWEKTVPQSEFAEALKNGPYGKKTIIKAPGIASVEKILM